MEGSQLRSLQHAQAGSPPHSGQCWLPRAAHINNTLVCGFAFQALEEFNEVLQMLTLDKLLANASEVLGLASLSSLRHKPHRQHLVPYHLMT